jgi:hypothetical protein
MSPQMTIPPVPNSGVPQPPWAAATVVPEPPAADAVRKYRAAHPDALKPAAEVRGGPVQSDWTPSWTKQEAAK